MAKAPGRQPTKKSAPAVPSPPKSKAKASAAPKRSPAKPAAKGKDSKPKESVRTVIPEIVDENAPEETAPSFAPTPEEEAQDADIEPVADSRALAVVTPGDKEITSRDPLALYLNEIRKYPVLSREEELEIAKKYFETKDPEAAQKLVKSNLRFVVKVAAEYSKFGAKMIDLIQEGNVGLMHAVREYNPYKGARVITYAVWWIRGYIQEYLMRQYSMVRIGTTQTQRKLFYQLQRQKEELEKMGKNADFALIGNKLGVSAEEVETMAQRLTGRDVSLDKPLDDDSGARLSDLQRSNSDESLDESLAHREELSLLREKISGLRPQLNERELILLEERLLADEPLTLQEIGDKYGITREAVRQAETRLMKKIKNELEGVSEKAPSKK